jgi:hypothetical protein
MISGTSIGFPASLTNRPPVSQREPSTDVVRDSGLDPPHLLPHPLLALTTPLDPSLLEQLAVLLLRHTLATLLDD